MLNTAIGVSLYGIATVFLMHGIRARRLKRLEAYEPMNPMILAASEIMRPILQIAAAYAAVKTSFMYYALGGPRIFPIIDFGGLIAVIAAYAVWIQLKMQPIAEPKQDDPQAAPAPKPRLPALPPELIPVPRSQALEPAREVDLVD